MSRRNDSNLSFCYAKTMAADDETADLPGREDSPGVRILLRLILGLFGGYFLGAVSYVVIWISFDPRSQNESLAVLAGLAGLVLGGAAVAFGAFNHSSGLRMLAWAAGGAGIGDILLGVIRGGLTVGAFLTPSGIVLAVVGAALGYRTLPPGNRPTVVRKV